MCFFTSLHLHACVYFETFPHRAMLALRCLSLLFYKNQKTWGKHSLHHIKFNVRNTQARIIKLNTSIPGQLRIFKILYIIKVFFDGNEQLAMTIQRKI